MNRPDWYNFKVEGWDNTKLREVLEDIWVAVVAPMVNCKFSNFTTSHAISILEKYINMTSLNACEHDVNKFGLDKYIDRLKLVKSIIEYRGTNVSEREFLDWNDHLKKYSFNYSTLFRLMKLNEVEKAILTKLNTVLNK